MKTITLNPALQESIALDVGLSFPEIEKRSATEIDKHIEKKIGKKLRIGLNYDVCSRGSVYMAMKRFIGLDKNGEITYDYEKM